MVKMVKCNMVESTKYQIQINTVVEEGKLVKKIECLSLK